MSKFLGFDSSSQSLTAVIIDTDTDAIVYRRQLIYEEGLPQYPSVKGVIPNDDKLICHSDPRMWLAALDLLLSQMTEDGISFAEISGISGSSQQHGTVYLNEKFLKNGFLPAAGESLADALPAYLSRPTSPIWRDLSTFEDCLALNNDIGGAEEMQKLTGSPATERFAGPQIRKFARTEPAAYAQTAVIHLVSSFMASVFTGKSCPIDWADGSGMNLELLSRRAWSSAIAEVTAPQLLEKLPPLINPTTICGELSPYFVEHYGFRAGTPVLAWSGDNPNSLIGMGAYKPGTVVVSLGTSDTYFSALNRQVFDPKGYGHVFISDAGTYQALICFQNGGLARETIRQKFGMTWNDFDDRAFQVTPAGNNGNIMLPYFAPESTPLVLNAGPVLEGSPLFASWSSGVETVRALVEAQAISMYLHSQWTGVRPKVLRLTGGASNSAGIAQVYADVFNARVERLTITDSAALGAAMRAANGIGKLSFGHLTRHFCNCDSQLTVTPIADNVAVYPQVIEKYRNLEMSI